jgi:hypothetical protein
MHSDTVHERTRTSRTLLLVHVTAVYTSSGGNILQVQNTPQTTNNLCFSGLAANIINPSNLWAITQLPAVGATSISDGGNDM